MNILFLHQHGGAVLGVEKFSSNNQKKDCACFNVLNDSVHLLEL